MNDIQICDGFDAIDLKQEHILRLLKTGQYMLLVVKKVVDAIRESAALAKTPKPKMQKDNLNSGH